MFEILKLLVIFLSLNNYRSTAEILKCSFVEEQWSHAPELYGCDVSNDIFTTKTQIDSVDGNHKTGKTNNDVKSILFHNNAKNTQYIPQGIEKFFPNLQLISIRSDSQKFNEIHQEDLKLFPKLKFLYLGNDLKVLEKDLFKFNPDLELIWLPTNKISQIDPRVFSDLKKLNFLILSDNNCSTALGSAFNRSEVEKIVKQVEQLQCVDHSYLSAEVVELKKENQKIVLKMNELKKKLIDERKNQNSQIKSLQDTAVKNYNQILELNGNMWTSRQENAKLHDDLTKKSSEIKTLNSSMVRAQVEIKNCQTNTEELKHEISDKAKIFHSLVSEKTAQSNSIRDMKADFDEFKLSIKVKESKIEQSNKELVEAVSKLSAQLKQNEIKNLKEMVQFKREVREMQQFNKLNSTQTTYEKACEMPKIGFKSQQFNKVNVTQKFKKKAKIVKALSEKTSRRIHF